MTQDNVPVLMERVGRYFKIFVVVLLIIAVWAILVAPDFDLDPTVVGGKQVPAASLCALVLLFIFAGCAIVLQRLRSRLAAPALYQLSPIELTCVRLC